MFYHMPFILHEMQGCIIFTGGVKHYLLNLLLILPDIFVEEEQNRRCCGDSQLLWQEPSKIID